MNKLNHAFQSWKPFACQHEITFSPIQVFVFCVLGVDDTSRKTEMSNVRDYGAVGNGIVKDTRAIQAAIDAGGIVTFTPGVYLTGTLYLHSNSYLEIQAGAVILGSPDMEDYNAADFVQQNVASKAEVTSGGHLIVAVECENVTLTGGGGIDGNQPAFVNEVNEAAPFMYKRSMRPAQMIFFCECTNVHVSNLVLRNSPYWTCFLHGCEEVTITGLHIHSHAMVLNDDGIDIDCCRRVTISDCIIDTGDDSITLRGSDVRLKKKRACEYIVVNNCVLTSRYANAIRVGVGNGVIRCASFNNIVITGYRTAISIVSNWSNDPKSSKGVDISEIDFSNIHSTARRFLNLKLDNLSDGEAKTSATIKDISIRNVRGTMELNNTVRGNGIGMVSGITLDDIRLTNFGKGTASDKDFKGAWGHVSTDASYEISNAKDVIIRNCKVVYPEDSKGWACDCRITDADVSFENTTFNCQK